MDKRFIIKCVRCSWSRATGSGDEEVKDLYEYKSCSKCKQFRRFRCPKCGHAAKQIPIRSYDSSKHTTTPPEAGRE